MAVWGEALASGHRWLLWWSARLSRVAVQGPVSLWSVTVAFPVWPCCSGHVAELLGWLGQGVWGPTLCTVGPFHNCFLY